MTEMRYELAIERIENIKGENTVSEKYRDYFRTLADFALLVDKLKEKIKEIRADWNKRHKKLAIYIEHDELEKIETDLAGLNGYLDKEPSEMDLNECTMMAGIPNAPSVYAPTKNPDLTKSRQEHVLETMVGNGYISQEEADEIINANT